MATTAIWPTLDYSRVPYSLYHDAELPHPGDFRATYLGETPVIINRDGAGVVHAFVNRCAHRGALVRRELSGNAKSHTCIYHQWCYGSDGKLTAIPFRRGIRGKGGMDADFDMSAHGLRRLKLGAVNGAWFGTLGEDGESLEEYLGPAVLSELHRFFEKKMRVLGYNRQ